MKIWRFIWILLLIIILLCATYAVAKWDEVQPKLAAFYQEVVAKVKPAETTEKKEEQQEKKEVQQEKKKPDTDAEKKNDNNDKEQAEKKAVPAKNRPLVFQVTNVSYNGGQISGFAPEGWLVQLTAGGKKLKTTQANKKDGRWVVSLNARDFAEKRVSITLSALSPNKKDTLTSSQTLDIDFSEENTAKPEIVRHEKGKKPFLMQKREIKKQVVSKTEKKVTPVSEKSTKVDTGKEEQKKAQAQKVVTASAGGSSSISSVKDKAAEKTSEQSAGKEVSGKKDQEKKVTSTSDDKKTEPGKKETSVKKDADKSGIATAKTEKPVAVTEKKTEQISKKTIVTASVAKDAKTLRKMDKGASRPEYHLVIFGDSLWKISARYYGDGKAYWKIYRMNRRVIRKMDLIYPGQKLRLP